MTSWIIVEQIWIIINNIKITVDSTSKMIQPTVVPCWKKPLGGSLPRDLAGQLSFQEICDRPTWSDQLRMAYGGSLKWGFHMQDDAPKIAKLPYKWLNSMVYGRYNYNYSYIMGMIMVFINQLITGGAHPVWVDLGIPHLRKLHVFLVLVRNDINPIGSMYGIYANISGILMVNVTIYSIHGSCGNWTCFKISILPQDFATLIQVGLLFPWGLLAQIHHVRGSSSTGLVDRWKWENHATS